MRKKVKEKEKLKHLIEIAKEMLKKGISIDDISEITYLPKEEILKLQDNGSMSSSVGESKN